MDNYKGNVVYEPAPGQPLNSAVEEAADLSYMINQNVTFRFNNHSIIITPETTPAQAVLAYIQKTDHLSNTYSNAAKKTEMADTLDIALKQGTDATIDWLTEYTRLAEYDNDNSHYPDIIRKLETAGYKTNDASFDSKTTVTADIMAKYVVANAMLNMEKGEPPHPAATNQFIAEYKKLAGAENHSPKPLTFG